MEEVPGTLVPESDQKHEKIANILKKSLKFVLLNSYWKTFHYIYKICGKILSNTRGNSVALEARETSKCQKNIKKPEKNCKI